MADYEQNIRFSVAGIREATKGIESMQQALDRLSNSGLNLELVSAEERREIEKAANALEKLAKMAEKASRELKKSEDSMAKMARHMKDYVREKASSFAQKVQAQAGVFDPVDLIFKGLDERKLIRKSLSRIGIVGGAGSPNALAGRIAPGEFSKRLLGMGLSSSEGLETLAAAQAAGVGGADLMGEGGADFFREVSFAAMNLLGDLSQASEVAKDFGHDMNTLGMSLEDVSRSMRIYSSDAAAAGVDQNRFYQALRQGVSGISIYSGHVDQLSDLLSTLQKGAGEVLGGRFFEGLLGAGRGMSFESRAFTGMMSKDILLEELNFSMSRTKDPFRRQQLEGLRSGVAAGDVISMGLAGQKIGDVGRLRAVVKTLESVAGVTDFSKFSVSSPEGMQAMTGVMGILGQDFDQAFETISALAALGKGSTAEALKNITERSSAALLPKDPAALQADAIAKFSASTTTLSEQLENASKAIGAQAKLPDELSTKLQEIVSGPLGAWAADFAKELGDPVGAMKRLTASVERIANKLENPMGIFPSGSPEQAALDLATAPRFLSEASVDLGKALVSGSDSPEGQAHALMGAIEAGRGAYRLRNAAKSFLDISVNFIKDRIPEPFVEYYNKRKIK